MGETSFGKYRLIAELGHGGMADVFLAVQAGPSGSGFRKLTVIKRLRQNLADEPEFVAMLVDEARIAARLNHPNVVQTNEVGSWEGQYFIAMEYLDGQPLHRVQHRSTQRVAKEGLPPTFGSDLQYIVMMDVLAGLHHAHELLDYDGTPLAIVHRDMTPHNVFVTYEGQVKVVDFGIAKAAGRASETRQGIIKGKVRYMAPEQAIGQAVDRRVDIFAVGVMLWEAATGKRMWKDKDDLQIVQALIGGDIPRSPRAVNPDVPEVLDAICQRALAQAAADRYPTAEAFRIDLEQYLIDTGILSRARRQIPAALDALFKDKRTEIRALIEKQLADVDEKGSGEFSAVALNAPASSASLPSMASSSASQSSQSSMMGPPSGTTNAHESLVEPATRRKRPLLAAFGLAVLLAGVAVLGVAMISRRNERARTTEAQQVSVRVNASPPTATVSIDDGPAEPVPLVKTVPRDDKHHKFVVRAEGYEPRVDLVLLTQDVVLSFELIKRAESPSSSAASTVSAKHATAHVPPPPWKPPVTPPPGNGKHPPPPTETAAPPPTSQPTSVPPSTATTAAVPTSTAVAPPATTAAAPPVDVAKEHRRSVNMTVRSHASEVQSCYDRAKMQSPQLAGSVSIAASLTASGNAPNAHVVNSSMHSAVGNGPAMLESCLIDRFRTWTFTPAPPGASNEISYTFRFE